MATVKVYNLSGEVVKDLELDHSVFGVKVNSDLVQLAVEAQEASSRQVLAHAKGRGEVRGGGKKPWKQKGTGRARHGSSRSPIWVGGGITFGPSKERNFAKAINQKAKNKALKMVLSDKVSNNYLVLVEEISLKEAKTKILHQILQKLPIKNQKTLLVLDSKNEEILRAARNLPNLSAVAPTSLNVVDVLKYKYLLMPVKAIAKIIKHFTI